MNRKYEKQYQQYLINVKRNGIGLPCTYTQWLKCQQIEQVATRKFNKVSNKVFNGKG